MDAVLEWVRSMFTGGGILNALGATLLLCGWGVAIPALLHLWASEARACDLMKSLRSVKKSNNTLNQLRDLCHSRARNAGWHDVQREDGTLIALIHSEVSEALEGLRKDAQDDHLPHRKMAEVELADALIRILDFAGLKGYDIAGAFEEKLEYNLRRLDHKREAREAVGGKRF